MDFGAWPPELSSAQMYSGPGAGPLLAAAAAWTGLAAALQESAEGCRAVITELTASWQGRSAAAMAAAAAPYVGWLTTTAAQAGEAADRVTAAAEAYQAAFAAIVPPPAIAANRSRLAALTVTNVLGQNTAAIAVTEAAYGQMWSQNAATMYGYAAAAAAAAQTTPFTAPPQPTDPTAQPAAPQAGPGGVITRLLDDLAAAGTRFNGYLAELDTALGGLLGSSSASTLYEDAFTLMAAAGKTSGIANVSMGAPNLGMSQFKAFFKPAITTVPIPMSALGAALHATPVSAVIPAARGLAAAVSATAGEANLVGRLSVPPSWASATPAIRLAATALADLGLTGAPEAAGPPALLPAMALGGLAGGALGGAGPRVFNATGGRGRTGAAKLRSEPVKLDQVVAQLQQQPDAVQHWNVDEAGFDDLIAELAKKPGVHAVHLSGR